MTQEDFSGVPISIGELRAEKTQKAGDWAPRDALVSLLREIDAGKIRPEALIIAWRDKGTDGGFSTHFVSAAPDGHTVLGLLEAAKFKMWGS